MKAAVIGCGRMGARPSSVLHERIPSGWLPISHIEAMQAVDAIQLSAICDLNEAVLQDCQSRYGIAQVFTDYQTMIREIKPEIISVATRTPVKKEIIEFACQEGVKGIYVEKPLANSIEAMQDIINVVKDNHVVLFYGVNRRYHEVYRKAREIIQSGEIGELQHISIEHGCSQLFWTHPHTMDLILFLYGQLDLEYTQAVLKLDQDCVNDTLRVDTDPLIEHAFFKFHSGFSASISPSVGNCTRINASKGSLLIHADGAFLQLNKSNNQTEDYFLDQSILHSMVESGCTVNAIRELYASIQDKKSVSISLDEIILNTKMLLSCVWSQLSKGQLIHLKDLPKGLEVTGRFGELYA
jgi:scyllo-inositol 2-dehydrogenase (NAD+)